MSRWSAGRLMLGFCAWVGLTTVSLTARAAEPERVRFDTVDGVEIHGTFYATTAKGGPAKTPCAIILHSIGGSSQQDGYDDLARKLNKEGICALTFDFRGHGSSTTVNDLFWKDLGNAGIRAARKSKDQISYKDFKSLNNYAMMVNDIAAAKRFLDRRNDNNECNSGSTFLIGSESGAALGALWLRTEWDRSKMTLGVPQVGTGRQLEGQDIGGAVWLSITPYFGEGKKFGVRIDNWFGSPIRERVPIMFLYGEGDAMGAKFSKHLYSGVLRADKDKDGKLKWTVEKAIKDTKLAGRDLLGKNAFGTEEWIIRFVTKVLEDKGLQQWTKRDADRLPLYRVPIASYGFR